MNTCTWFWFQYQKSIVTSLFLFFCLCLGLAKHNCTPEKIQYVVCTHGHSDHIGNNNLFQSAIHIVSHDICVGDLYQLHGFKQVISTNITNFMLLLKQ